MNATKQIGTLDERKMVDTNGLQAMHTRKTLLIHCFFLKI